MYSRRAFTIIELLLVIAIIGILASILFPVIAKAKNTARSAKCLSNLKQIGVAVKAYCNDYRDKMPVIDTLYVRDVDRKANYDPLKDPAKLSAERVLGPYLVDSEILVCPDAVNGLPYGVGAGRYRITYVFYGRDYTKSAYGVDMPDFQWDQFNGKVQQTTLAHGAENEASGVLWVRDSVRKSAAGSREKKTPHGPGRLNRLYSDGHVRASRPESHALAADF